MRTKRRKRLKRARRRRRVLVLTTALALIAATLAITFYTVPAMRGAQGRESNSNQTPKVSADSPGLLNTCRAACDYLLVAISHKSQAAPPSQVVMLQEPPGDADQIELNGYTQNLNGGMDDYGAIVEEFSQSMDAAHDQLINAVVEAEHRRRLVSAVNRWLDHRHSPCAGTGELWVQAQERTGVSAALMVAIFDKESTSGTNGALSRNNHNGWGQFNGSAMWWPDWPTAIAGAFDFMNWSGHWPQAQTAYDCHGYCAGTPASWLNEVENVRSQVVEWAE